MKKILLLIVFIFILCILIQYNYLVEKFDVNSDLLIVTMPRKVTSSVATLFTNDHKKLRNADGSVYLNLLTTDYDSLASEVNNYKKNYIKNILTEYESSINKELVHVRFGRPGRNVYIIGSSTNERTPTSTDMLDIKYNIAGEYLKYIDNVLYVYSGLIQKQNMADINENGLNLYLEGWVREDLRVLTDSQPNIKTIQKYAEEYSNNNDLCLHTDENSKIYKLDDLMKYKDTGKKAAWKVTYDGEKLNWNSKWINGMRNGLNGELGKRLAKTTSEENGGIKPIFTVEHPYCNDKSKIKVTAVSEIDINKVDLYFGLDKSELPNGETPLADPLQSYYPPVKSYKTIDLTVPVDMTDECAVTARKLIKRKNGNTLELFQDKRKEGCESAELSKFIYKNLVEFKDVIITTPYVQEPVSTPVSPPVSNPVLNPVSTPVSNPVSNPVLDLPPVQPRITNMMIPEKMLSNFMSPFKFNNKYIKKYANNRFTFHRF